MTATFKDHIVYNPQGISYEDLKWINICRVLDAMSTYVMTSGCTTYIDIINSFVRTFYPGVEYDPECLFNPDLLDEPANTEVFNSSKLDIIMTLEATIRNNS